MSRDKLPMEYTCLYYLEDYNLIKTFKDGKYGIVDTSIKKIIPCVYDDIKFLYHKIWAERKIDEKTSLMTIYSYDGIVFSYEKYSSYPTPIVSKIINGNIQYGIVDEYSNEEVECSYDKIKPMFYYNTIKQDSSLGNYFAACKNYEWYIYQLGKGFRPEAYDCLFSETDDEELVDLLSILYHRHNNKYFFGVRYNNLFAFGYNRHKRIIDIYLKDNLVYSFDPDDIELSNYITEVSCICHSKHNDLYSIMTSKGLSAPFIYKSIYLHDHLITSGQGMVALDVLVAYRETKYENMFEVDFYSTEGKLLLEGIPSEKINWKKNKKINDTILLYAEDIIIFNIKSGFINRLPIDSIFDLDSQMNKCITVQARAQMCLIDLKGNIVIPLLLKPENQSYISEHVIKNDGAFLSYYIVNNGQVNQTTYDYVEESPHRLFKIAKYIEPTPIDEDAIEKGPYFGVIDINGNEILPCHYHCNNITILNSNCIRISEDGTYRYIDGKGWPIIKDIKFYNGEYHISVLKNGRLLVYDKQQKIYFITDKNQNRISSEEFISISESNLNGIAKISIGESKDGLINLEGDIVLPCEYELPYDWVRESNNVISSGRPSLMKIFSKNNEAYIDLQGNLVVPPIYSTIELFYQEGFALVCKNGKSGLISLACPTSTIIECEWDSIVTYSFDKDDFASATGYLPSYRFAASDQSKESHILLATTSTESCIYDLKLGKVIMTIPFRISSIRFRYKSIWGLCQKNNENKNEYILWDTSKLASYEQIGKRKNECIQVKKNDKWGLYDLNSRHEIIPCLYFENYNFTEMNDKFLFFNGYSSIVYHDKKYYLINIHNEIISSKYDALEDFIDGVAIFQQGDKYGLINIKGIELTSGYERLQRGYHEPISSSLIICELNDIWGFINSKGEIITLRFERVYAFHEGYAAVKQNGKWGFINEYGKIVIPCRFANVDSFSEGLAAVAFKKRWGYIDKHNNTIIPFKYDDAYPFYKGKADVCISEREGSYDLSISKNGRILEEKFTANESEIDYNEAKRDSWYAMTDGVYGDYPDDFDGDYDFMGH